MLISNKVFQELKKLIDLPDNCFSATIHLTVNEPVRVECECYASEGSGEMLTRKFRLVETEDD